jgi:ATP-dependent DNA helicase RecG
VDGPRSLSSLAAHPVSALDGIRPAKARALAQVGVHSLLDLITYYPRYCIDRSRQKPIAELKVGDQVTLIGHVVGRPYVVSKGRAARVEVVIGDGTGRIPCVFFNQPWLTQQLTKGRRVAVFGKVELYRGRRQLARPVVDLVGDRTGRIVPVYPQSGKAGLTTLQLEGWIDKALEWAKELEDPLPQDLLCRLDLVGRAEALRQIHKPGSMDERDRARRRLAFDELFRLQVALVSHKRAMERRSEGICHPAQEARRGYLGDFVANLPFALTAAQARAIEQVCADMAAPHPMHRLLQGDVGAGKTVVALAGMLVAVQGGRQAALMAPTEVLAEQHHATVVQLLSCLEVPDEGRLLGRRPLRAELLTSRRPARQRAAVEEGLRSGEVDLVVGTHALLTEGVDFARLGMVVIDEQHRFGVEQRFALRAKGKASGGRDPDLLVMTATPIPRTAAMTLFGDLDMTVLDELPAGRSPVRTLWCRGPLDEEAAYQRVRQQVAAGHQAFVVCPLVEGSEAVQAKSATAVFERLRHEVFPDLPLGLLHGQLPGRRKEQVMDEFRRNRLAVLVATSVVEVGVDVPNATVMLVEDAARFGLAQLHQLRGRVGRGQAESWCFLLGQAPTPEAERRLTALEETSDGFELAEIDLELRGEGTITGAVQTGSSDLKLASLRQDRQLVEQARQAAFELVDADPDLEAHRALRDEISLMVSSEAAGYLFKS